MPVPMQDIEEALSVSYVSAIVAMSGYTFNTIDRDFGVDCEVRRVMTYGSKRIDCGACYDLQLKATVNWELKDDHIIYDMRAEAYNKIVIRNRNSSTSCFLVLMCLPKEESEWMSISEQELKLRKCCYFYYLKGDETSNSSGIRIRIPISNILSPEAIEQLDIDVRKGVYAHEIS